MFYLRFASIFLLVRIIGAAEPTTEFQQLNNRSLRLVHKWSREDFPEWQIFRAHRPLQSACPPRGGQQTFLKSQTVNGLSDLNCPSQLLGWEAAVQKGP